jgi:LmbE family N-acetylglucosaminyl deacetylase
MTTLLAIFAHPDDESFGMAGTLAKAAAAGVRTALVCVTAGEAGKSAGLADSPQALARVRAGELQCAANAMGIADLTLLDYPDGGAEGWDLEALATRLADQMYRIRPDVIVTFDEHGITRHPDHMALHRGVRLAIAKTGGRLNWRRLFYQVITCPEEASPEGPTYACTAPEAVDVIVDIAAFEPVKRAALRCHRTQTADTAWMLDRPDGSLTVEHYVLASAAGGWRPGPGCADLMAGL